MAAAAPCQTAQTRSQPTNAKKHKTHGPVQQRRECCKPQYDTQREGGNRQAGRKTPHTHTTHTPHTHTLSLSWELGASQRTDSLKPFCSHHAMTLNSCTAARTGGAANQTNGSEKGETGEQSSLGSIDEGYNHNANHPLDLCMTTPKTLPHCCACGKQVHLDAVLDEGFFLANVLQRDIRANGAAQCLHQEQPTRVKPVACKCVCVCVCVHVHACVCVCVHVLVFLCEYGGRFKGGGACDLIFVGLP